MGLIQTLKSEFAKKVKALPEDPETIMVGYARDKDGNIIKGMVNTVPFKPDMLIERCGKIYRVDKKGTQRFVCNKGDV